MFFLSLSWLFILLLKPEWGLNLGSPGSSLLNEQIALQEEDKSVSDSDKVQSTLSITVVGASGDLAKKKIFPALFALYYEDCLPEVLSHATTLPSSP